MLVSLAVWAGLTVVSAVLSPVAGLALGVMKVEVLSVTKSSSTEPTLSVSSDMATRDDDTQTGASDEAIGVDDDQLAHSR